MTSRETCQESRRRWQWELDELLCNCAAASGVDSGELLRDAFDLLSRAPISIRTITGRLPDFRHFNALIALGAYESAVLTLLGDSVGYMLSSGANGASFASIILPGMTEDISAEGPNVELALLTAFTAALHHGANTPQPNDQISVSPSLRLN